MLSKLFKRKDKNAEAAPAAAPDQAPAAKQEKVTRIGLMAKLSVANKIGLVLVMLIIAIAGIVGSTLLTLERNKTLSLLVDVANQQQILAQRHFAEVLMVTQGNKADFQGTRKFFFDTLHALTVGGLVNDL